MSAPKHDCPVCQNSRIVTRSISPRCSDEIPCECVCRAAALTVHDLSKSQKSIVRQFALAGIYTGMRVWIGRRATVRALEGHDILEVGTNGDAVLTPFGSVVSEVVAQ